MKKKIISAIIVVVLIVVGIIVVKTWLVKPSGENNKKSATSQSVKARLGTEESNSEGDFLMPIDTVFNLTNRGIVISGKIERGTISVNDSIEIVGFNSEPITTTVIEIEAQNEKKVTAKAGDNIGLVVSDIKLKDLKRGQVIATPKTIKSTKKFAAEVYIYKESEGGIATDITSNYQAKFFFRVTNVEGTLKLNKKRKASPGDDNVKMTIELESAIGLEEGTEFSIKKDDKVIAGGFVTKVY